MSAAFDPYYKWLSIPPSEQPPHHYRLLGIALFESDPEVIEGAADRQMMHVKLHASGPHSEQSQQLLNQLAQARLCLLNASKRAAYDQTLRSRWGLGELGRSSPAAGAPSAHTIGSAPAAGLRPIAAAPVASPAPASAEAPPPWSTPTAAEPGIVELSPVQRRVRARAAQRRKLTLMAMPAVVLIVGALVFVVRSLPEPTAVEPQHVAQSPSPPVPDGPPVANEVANETEAAEVDPTDTDGPTATASPIPVVGEQPPTPITPSSSPTDSLTGAAADSQQSTTQPDRRAAQPSTPSDVAPEESYSLTDAQLAAARALTSTIEQSLEAGRPKWTAMAGQPTSAPASSHRAAIAVGAYVTMTTDVAPPAIVTLGPISLLPDGTATDAELNADPKAIKVRAKSGYALAGFQLSYNDRLRGGKAIFRRITADGLDPNDQYESPWFGVRAARLAEVATRGEPVVGIGISGVPATGLALLYAGGSREQTLAQQNSPDRQTPADALADRHASQAEAPPGGDGAPTDRQLPGVDDLFAPSALQARQPAPKPAALEEAKKLVEEIFAEDLQKATDPASQHKLADLLHRQAMQSIGEPAAQYVLFEQSCELAAEAGQFGLAWEILDDFHAAFEVNVLPQKQAALEQGARLAKQPAHFKIVAEKWSQLSREALAQYDLEMAQQCAVRASAAARRARDAELRIASDDWEKELKRLEPIFAEALLAKTAWEKNPKNQAAAQQWGEFLCVHQQQWDKGLPIVAEGSDAALAELARRDVAQPQDAEARVDLADQWWEMADAAEAESPEQLAYRGRAAHWYQYALPMLSGVTKIKAEKRIEDARAAMPGNPRGWIKLLPLVDTARDSRSGTWTRNGAVLSTINSNETNMLVFPVEVTQSYELRFSFAVGDQPNRAQYSHRAQFTLPVGETQCELTLGTSESGLQRVNGLSYADSNNPTNVSPSLLRDNTPYQVLVRVDVDGDQARIGVTINGRAYIGWQGHRNALSTLTYNATHQVSPGMLGIQVYSYTLLNIKDVEIRASAGVVGVGR